MTTARKKPRGGEPRGQRLPARTDNPMSVHRNSDNTRRSLTDLEVLAWADFSAQARGCTCQPDITIHQHSPQVKYVEVAQDDDCPAAERGAA